MIKLCEQCARPFRVFLSDAKKGKGRYCSITCYSAAGRSKIDPEIRFWEKVDKSAGIDGCWVWKGSKDHKGYGYFNYGPNNPLGSKDVQRTHRIAFYFSTGIIPKGMILHSCDNPPCCNPKHLREGTHIENTKDAVDRARYKRGTHHHSAKITEQIVVEIRSRVLTGETQVSLAKEFRLSKMTINDIIKRRTWNWIYL